MKIFIPYVRNMPSRFIMVIHIIQKRATRFLAFVSTDFYRKLFICPTGAKS